MINKKIQLLKYLISDIVSAILAWVLFFVFRKVTIEYLLFKDPNQIFLDSNLIKGIIFIPVFWVTLYFFQGFYQKVYVRSRLKDFVQTLVISLIGVVILFFAFLLDDYVATYTNYYLYFAVLFVLHFTITYIPRYIITSITVKKVHRGKIEFPTILVVSNAEKALSLSQEIKNQVVSSGMSFAGYLSLKGERFDKLEAAKIPFLATVDEIQEIIDKKHIENVIFVLAPQDEDAIYNIILNIKSTDIEMFMPSDRKDLLTGNIKLRAIFSVPMVRISQIQMTPWEFTLKRIFDIVVSLVAMIILSPVYLAVAIIVKTTSQGPVFYKQERIGKGGKPFYIYKFRSMYTDAEKFGPKLSSGDNDPRITPFGRFMRKVRLDEIPQLAQVFVGDMSMVGPRPERQFFIDQIVVQAPEYKLLHKIKPGMTSWGQVKFGYAETVDEMVVRLKYDLLYLDNMSITTDIKILIYTVLIIFQGRGK